jgi:hypothetical protein
LSGIRRDQAPFSLISSPICDIESEVDGGAPEATEPPFHANECAAWTLEDSTPAVTLLPKSSALGGAEEELDADSSALGSAEEELDAGSLGGFNLGRE